MSERVEISKSTDKNGAESLTYSKSWDKGGLHYRKEVRKVEGGYIICESKYGTPEGDDEKYVDERKEYVTTENPFDEAQDKTEDEKLFSFVDTPLM